MILDFFFNPKKINKNIFLFFIIGLVYTSISILLSVFTFRNEASMLMIFLTVISIAPYIYFSIKHEEEEDLKLNSEKEILKKHSKTLMKFIFLFLGITLAFAFWFLVFDNFLVQDVYRAQIETYLSINPDAKLDFLANNITGYVTNGLSNFITILLNNLMVLFFCLLFSFLFGLGAVFILTWNASIIGTAMGIMIKNSLVKTYALSGIDRVFLTIRVILHSFIKFFFHGILEISAYFTIGLAGGIISIATIKHHYKTKKFKKIAIDSIELIIISIILIILAAIFEVYLTPLLF